MSASCDLHLSSMREMKARKVALSSSNALICWCLSRRSLASCESAVSCWICACTRSRHSPMARCRWRRLASCASWATCMSCCRCLRCSTSSSSCCSPTRCARTCVACRSALISSSFSASSHSMRARRRRSAATRESICCAEASNTACRLPAVASTLAESVPTVPEASKSRRSASWTCSRKRAASSSRASTSARRTWSSTSCAATSCPRPLGSS
mmetsp:Transcript_39327/g.119036  ORF Transcript_39327/g.119036 Transcript_39327/m.119036 type:complete len:213 (-) Transcript_39327:350-988(-)